MFVVKLLDYQKQNYKFCGPSSILNKCLNDFQFIINNAVHRFLKVSDPNNIDKNLSLTILVKPI